MEHDEGYAKRQVGWLLVAFAVIAIGVGFLQQSGARGDVGYPVAYAAVGGALALVGGLLVLSNHSR